MVGLATVAFVALDVAWVTSPDLAHMGKRVAQQMKGRGAKPVPLRQVAPVMRRAIVAAEDERFYSHHGVDAIGIARAIAYDVSHLSTSQGASTITEQVAELLYLRAEDNPWEKVREGVVAVRLESDYSKAQILDAYLNTVGFGPHADGIAAATRRYFGVPPSRLDLAQASLLAGLPQDPAAYDPFRHHVDARQRQAEVLRSMIRDNLTTTSKARAAARRPLRLAHGPPLAPLRSPDLVPEPALAAVQLAGGLALCAAAITLLALAWRRRLGPVPLAFCWLLILAGALLAAGSVRAA